MGVYMRVFQNSLEDTKSQRTSTVVLLKDFKKLISRVEWQIKLEAKHRWTTADSRKPAAFSVELFWNISAHFHSNHTFRSNLASHNNASRSLQTFCIIALFCMPHDYTRARTVPVAIADL